METFNSSNVLPKGHPYGILLNGAFDVLPKGHPYGILLNGAIDVLP
jgi:hypothetical protein